MTWVILPTYNEVDNLCPLIEALQPVLAHASSGHRILIVDDDSPDGTGNVADALSDQDETIEVLHQPTRFGLAHSYLAGFALALERGAAYVVQMDADLSHDPADVERLLDKAAEGVDIVVGSRYVAGGGLGADWPRTRRAISRAGCWYARTMLSVHVRDLTSGFKCFRRSALAALPLESVRSQGYAFQVELTYRAIRHGLSVSEVPIVFHDRHAGESKMTLPIILEAAWRVPQLRLRRP